MNQTVGRYRWTICSLVFFATTINYLDRAVISLLKGTLEKEFSWTETDYSNIVIIFQLMYALGMLGAGRLIDKLGTRIGYALATFLWSVAAMSHAFVSGLNGFLFARGFLGVTESGNFPAAIKATAEWFPQRERALATGIFNSGANVGAILAPLTVPFIAEEWGWKWAFLITGFVGFIWLIFWFLFYEVPTKHKKVSAEELAYINIDADTSPEGIEEDKKPVSWFRLFGFRQTWAFILGKFLTDPVWWFYLFWLPDFLKKEYGITGTGIAMPIAIAYTIATFGSVIGGWLPLKFINSGWPVFRSRKTSMLIYALIPLTVLFAQYLGSINMWLAVIVIAFAMAAHQAWSANIGAPDLITVRGRDLIASCPVCLYAGSLVPKALLGYCPSGARIVDTAPMSLDEIVAEFKRATDEGQDVARLHSGDLSIWSALGEQLRRLEALDIPFTVTPGVPAFAAAAAALAKELTLPEVAQSVVLTRTSGRASSMPETESLSAFAATRATLAIHLSIHALEKTVAELIPAYGEACPVAVVFRASWPDERVIRATLGTIVGEVQKTNIDRTALILVGEVLAARDFRDSALYDSAYQRRFRGRGS